MAKYSFDTITLGEILDNEDASKLFWELVPEAKDYADMLEMGRPLTISEAMPYIETIADGLGIENVQDRVEDFKTKLESL
jgi:3-keto-L-gulonate-6-phosphate decarboxylase